MRSLRCVLLVVVLVLLLVAARAGVAVAAVADRGWRLPVDGHVLRLFSVAPDRYAAGQHRGVDLAAPPGTAVRAACAGRVSFAGRVPGGGRTVSVACGQLVATYQHLGEVAVRGGQVVGAGVRIGTVGRARPRPHVHLGARVAATGAYVDPLTLVADGAVDAPPVAVPLPPRRAPPPRPFVPAPELRRPAPVHPAPARQLRVPAPRPPDVLPWPVWLGLGLVGLGLPIGGLVRVRRRRRRRAAARMPLAVR